MFEATEAEIFRLNRTLELKLDLNERDEEIERGVVENRAAVLGGRR